jgi:hypothetical protein
MYRFKLILTRFLLARVYVESLQDLSSVKAVKTALKRLQQDSNASDNKIMALDRAYQNTLKRIDSRSAGSRKFAMRILSWITYAVRPLSMIELQHALATEINESELDEDNIPDVEYIISICAGLLNVDKESNLIRLIHHTAQEYLERTKDTWFPKVQDDMTMTTLIYLSFDRFSSNIYENAKDLEELLSEYPLYDYAARNWGYHARGASCSVARPILTFLSSERLVSNSTQMIELYDSNFDRISLAGGSALHLAAYFGLEDTPKVLLADGEDPNSTDADGWTPLL